MKSAQSVRLTAAFTASGGEKVTIDFTSFSNGDVDGTATLNGNPANIIIIGQTLYINADAAYWIASSAPHSEANEFANKWVSGNVTGSYSGYTMSELESELDAHPGSARAGTTGTVDGQAAVSVQFSTGPLWVATTGPAYPIEAEGAGGTSLIFSDWNEGTAPTAPPGAKPASSF